MKTLGESDIIDVLVKCEQYFIFSPDSILTCAKLNLKIALIGRDFHLSNTEFRFFQKQSLLEFICSIKILNKAPVPDRSAPTRPIYLVYWIRINFNTWFVTTQIIFDFMMPPKSKQYSMMVMMIYLLKLTEWLRLNTKKSPPNSIKKQKRQIIRTTNHTAGKLIIFNPNGPELQNPLVSK